ncbi:DUF6134 family protein [Magnetovibrio sp. PR-2]|uniref:DUF6134 family protein n=1 Tax=Magnetovibrio sp. PR-2 TaxID=3120356 RepID=UPI002FCE3FA6
MKRTFLSIFALLAALLPQLASAQSTPETLNYAISRDGEIIGSHRVTVSQIKHQIRVDVHTEIKIEGFFTTKYAFDHSAQETWAGGVLYEMTAITESDGKTVSVQAYEQNGRLIVDSLDVGMDRRQILPLGLQPSSLWNADTVNQTQLLNAHNGKVLSIKVEDLGPKTVTVQGIETPVHHYALSGELTRELWYDENGRLVRLKFPDNSTIPVTYTIK